MQPDDTAASRESAIEPIDVFELDRMVDAGEDITEYMDTSTICHPGWGEEIHRVNVDCPD